MIEQDIATLWKRARGEKVSRWDAAAARAELRARGLDPYRPPQEVEVKSGDCQQPAEDGEETLPAATSHVPEQVRDEASLAPLPQAGGVGGGCEPRREPRHTGWTRARMAGFLRHLARTGSVAAAAAHVGMGRQSVYKLRRRLAGSPFDIAWDRANRAGRHRAMLERIDAAGGPPGSGW